MMMTLRLVALAAAALSLSACQKMDDAAFGARVRTYLLAHPEVLREVSTKLAENDRVAAERASSDAIAKYRGALEHDSRDFVANPEGKITVVEFFDYRCGYCKLAAPQVVDLIEKNPDVRFVFKQFPIFGEVSDSAAKIALTREGKAKGFQLYQALMADKALDEAALDRHLTELGLDPAQIRKDAEHPQIERQIKDAQVLATELKIDGTPAFIVGDTMVPGADMAALKAAIERARAARGPTGSQKS